MKSYLTNKTHSKYNSQNVATRMQTIETGRLMSFEQGRYGEIGEVKGGRGRGTEQEG